MNGRSADGAQRMRLLVVSPTNWGTLRLSKHHYAVELARRGHEVVYLNPPDRRLGKSLRIEAAEGLNVVTFRPWFPLRLRHMTPRLYDILMRRVVRHLMHRLGMPFDVVWCFDSDLYPKLDWFGARLRVYHVVDQVLNDEHARVGSQADLVLAVSPSIAQRIAPCGAPPLVLPHGLARPFADEARAGLNRDDYRPGAALNVGYAGNLWSQQLDRDALRRTIEAYPDVQFHIWGPVETGQSNVGVVPSEQARNFIEYLKRRTNVTLRGVVTPATLAPALGAMDALLLCYDPQRDRNGGANSHKLLEYLATGRVVVANRVGDYVARPGLLEMLPSEVNEGYIELCGSTFASIASLNSREQRARRRQFALRHTYEQHAERLERLFMDALERGPYVAAVAFEQGIADLPSGDLPGTAATSTLAG